MCQKWNVLAITDEIYEHIVYDGHTHHAMAMVDGMQDRTITINALSKTYSVTGWRVGYVIASPELTRGIRKVHDFLTVGAPAPLQEAGARALALPEEYYTDLAAAYQRRTGSAAEGIAGHGIPLLHAAGRLLHHGGFRRTELA